MSGNGSEPVYDEDVRGMLRDNERLRRELADERARGQAAQSSAVEDRWAADERVMEATRARLDGEATALQQHIVQLYEAGNFAELGTAQRQLARLEAQLAQTEQQKLWLANAREQHKTQRERQPTREEYMSRFTPLQRDWIDRHPEYLTDQTYQNRVVAAHHLTVSDGIQVDTPEYFRSVEKYAGAPGGRGPRAMEREEPTVDEYYVDDAPVEPPPAAPPRDERGAIRRTGADMPVTRRSPDAPRRDAPLRLTADERDFADTTMPDVPVNDWRDSNGVLQPGRYRRYKMNQATLRANGRLNS